MTTEIKNIKKLISKYEFTCSDIMIEFTKKYFYDEEFGDFNIWMKNYTLPIGNEVDGVWDINEYFFNLSDMAIALKHDTTREVLIEWYNKSLDYGMYPKKYKPVPNLKNYTLYPELRN